MIQFNTIRRIFGWISIALGFWFLTPPGFPPDDFINIFVGDIISQWFGVSLVTGIIVTYTIVPFLLIYGGCVILPGDTHKLFNGFLTKIRDIVLRILRDPRLVVIAIILATIMYFTYVLYISPAVTQLIEGMA